MEPFKIYWPAKPFYIHQVWGLYNPMYMQFGFSLHNGVDFALGADKTLYAPCDGTIVRTGNQPTGGGIFVGMITPPRFFPDGVLHNVLIDFLHCEKLLVKEGQWVKVGDPIAIADNTGLSTGPHTHMQLRRVRWNGLTGDKVSYVPVDVNNANNSFDPSPYWGTVYAQDYWTMVGKLQQLLALLQKLVVKQ